MTKFFKIPLLGLTSVLMLALASVTVPTFSLLMTEKAEAKTENGKFSTGHGKKIHNTKIRRNRVVIGRRIPQPYYTFNGGANFRTFIPRSTRIHQPRFRGRHAPGWSSKRFHAKIGIRVKQKPWRGRLQTGATLRVPPPWMQSGF